MFTGKSTLIPIGLALTIASAQAAVVEPALTLDRPVVAHDSGCTVNLLVRFDAPEPIDDAGVERPPVQLALVIDRSGSMQEAGKLVYAKAAAKSLIELLRPADRLAIVDYDNRVTVLWPSAPVVAPELTIRAVDGLTPRGGTNLAAGLAAGLAEIGRDKQTGFTCRTILLSDGLANQGETRASAIAAMAAEARRGGVAVTTMGLGRDYNEDLMQTVAAGGGGRYYYIENPAAMQRIFQEEMGKVLRQSTRELALWFEHGAAIRGVTVYGYPFETAGNRTTIGMKDLYGGDAISVLLSLELAAPGTGRFKVGRIGLSYVDAADGRRHQRDFPVTVTGSADAALVAASVDVPTAVEATLIVADECHDQAVRAFESGDKPGALASLAVVRQDVSAAANEYGDPKLTKKLEALSLEEADMNRAERDPAYRSGYLKRSKEAFYGSRQGKRDKYLLDQSAKGLDVENLQKALADRGHYHGAPDGQFDDEVRAAVAAFQAASGLDPDGIAGPLTLRALGLY
ncbi:MAG: VWA domain-containing protein [bacterium]|nr:VWA domain-containing protein [bacterium]